MTAVQYLNVDLDVDSKQDVSAIIAALGENVIVLHHGLVGGYHHASFEIVQHILGADEVINYFCTLVEALPDQVREVWDNCRARILDIGYESGTSSGRVRTELRRETIQRVAAMGASIAITIYPVSENSRVND